MRVGYVGWEDGEKDGAFVGFRLIKLINGVNVGSCDYDDDGNRDGPSSVMFHV